MQSVSALGFEAGEAKLFLHDTPLSNFGASRHCRAEARGALLSHLIGK